MTTPPTIPESELDHIRAIAEIKDIGYSQSSNQFTSYSIDRALLRKLLSLHDELQQERDRLRGLLKDRDDDWKRIQDTERERDELLERLACINETDRLKQMTIHELRERCDRLMSKMDTKESDK